jgi:hypothetical protein
MLHLRAMNRPTSPVSLLKFDMVNTQHQPDDGGSVRVTACFFVHSTGHEGRDWLATWMQGPSVWMLARASVSSFEDAKHVLAFSSTVVENLFVYAWPGSRGAGRRRGVRERPNAQIDDSVRTTTKHRLSL